jgi:hypothetical protein
LTVLPLVVLPNRKESELPTRFCGLSLERKSHVNILNVGTSDEWV